MLEAPNPIQFLEIEGEMLIRVKRRLSISFFKILEVIFGSLGIKFTSPLELYARLWGKNRLVDILLSDPNFKEMLDSMQQRFPGSVQLGEILPRVTIVIPVHQKDFEMLQLVLDGVSDNSLNPIEEILIITPNRERPDVNSRFPIRYLTDSEALGPAFLSEEAEEISSGWIKQQLIKICSVLNHVSTSHNVILDSDTVICAPRLFATQKYQELSFSKEYHSPYMSHVERFDPALKSNGLSYVTHYQVWQQSVVREIWGGDKLMQWLKVRDKSILIGISEYQTYGQYLITNFRNSIKVTRWGNFGISRMELKRSGVLKISSSDLKISTALSVSVHSYS